MLNIFIFFKSPQFNKIGSVLCAYTSVWCLVCVMTVEGQY